jgi:hypothetical protein
MLLLTVEADIVDAGLLLWRLLMIASVEFGAANRVTTNDEKSVTTLVTAVKFVDIGTILSILIDVWYNFVETC